MTISSEDLCKGCPKEFSVFVEYCKNLLFEEEPKYDYLRNLILKVAKRYQIDLSNVEFDWDEASKTTCEHLS